jgi:hypothetical protein
MPFEIRQIGIRLAVGDEDQGEAPRAPQDGAAPGVSAAERARMVRECVAAVMAELRAGRER